MDNACLIHTAYTQAGLGIDCTPTQKMQSVKKGPHTPYANSEEQWFIQYSMILQAGNECHDQPARLFAQADRGLRCPYM